MLLQQERSRGPDRLQHGSNKYEKFETFLQLLFEQLSFNEVSYCYFLFEINKTLFENSFGI